MHPWAGWRRPLPGINPAPHRSAQCLLGQACGAGFMPADGAELANWAWLNNPVPQRSASVRKRKRPAARGVPGWLNGLELVAQADHIDHRIDVDVDGNLAAIIVFDG